MAVINGNNDNNALTGTGSADTINGFGGSDWLIGGTGADHLNGGDGNDIATYTDSTAAVLISLTSGLGAGGEAEGDIFNSIERLGGSSHNDTLIGNAAANELRGMNGDDILEGAAGADAIYGDYFDGTTHSNSGTDTASYYSSSATVVVNLTTGTGSGGDAAGDTLWDIENLTGSSHNDQLIGNTGANVLDGGAGSDWLIGGAGADRLIGGDGNDIVTYTDSTAAVLVSLTSGLGAGGEAEGDTLSGVERLGGSSHNDTLIGDAAANELRGMNGDDILEGAAGADAIYGDYFDGTTHSNSGTDTASYYSSSATVVVNLTTGTGSGGDAAGDTLWDIENLTGSSHNDQLIGNTGANVLDGGAGSDWLIGGAGADRLIGGDGNDIVTYTDSTAAVLVSLTSGLGAGGEAEGDTLSGVERLGGSSHNDTLIGDAAANELRGMNGDDILEGAAGADAIYGDYFDGTTHSNSGIDTASYYSSSASVVVNLTTGTGSGGDAAGDTLWDIENLTGSSHNDSLTGNGGANVLDGLDGADVLEGLDGADALQGGAGDDVLRGGAGADRLDGGAGIDTASYFTSSTGIAVSLLTGKGSGGEAQGDTLAGIETLSGSQGNDGLEGDAGANTLQGWGGNDALVGGAGKDILTGGAGADRFYYTSVSDSVVGADADRITDFSHAQADRIDLHLIDADTGTAGDQAFSFIGTALYTGVAGELRYAVVNGVSTIAGDVNGDKVSDFHIQLASAITLVAVDFVL